MNQSDTFSDNSSKKTIEDLMKFDEETEKMFVEMTESKGERKAALRCEIRIRLLKNLGRLKNLSLEENFIELKRNITVLRMKLKHETLKHEKRVRMLVDENEKQQERMGDIWKKERAKWTNAMRHLKQTIAALETGDSKPINADADIVIHKLTNIQNSKNPESAKDDLILQQKSQIELLQFEISQLKNKLNNSQAANINMARNSGMSSNALTRQSLSRNNNLHDVVRRRSSITRSRISTNLDAMDVMTQKSINDLAVSFQQLKNEYNTVCDEVENNKKEYSRQMANMMESMTSITKQHGIEFANMTNKYKQAMTLKRKYFNQIQELRGNIRVFARIRPLLPKVDGGDKARSVVTVMDEENLEIMDKNSKPHNFTFNKVYGCKTTQKQVYSDTRPYIESCMDGYNVCIFAYGQTGSGKTFTMMGEDSDKSGKNLGVNIRALKDLFFIKNERSPDFEYKIYVSMVEIYNEKIRDLLIDPRKAGDISYKIRHGSSGIYVDNLSEKYVQDENDVMKIMKLGMDNRSVTATKSNQQSSRSHCVLTINIKGTNKLANLTYMGKLHLIDLAGSERVDKSGVTGQAMKEAQNINKSLSALGDVISALNTKTKDKNNGHGNKSAHIPYRNSTLTHMLQDSLGGHAKTLMFVNVSPAEYHSVETITSCRFGQRAKEVELGPTKKRVMRTSTSTSASSSSRVSSDMSSRTEEVSALPRTKRTSTRTSTRQSSSVASKRSTASSSNLKSRASMPTGTRGSSKTGTSTTRSFKPRGFASSTRSSRFSSRK